MTDRQLVALLMSAMGLMMPVVMLSGLMFPIENMPIVLQGIAQIIPAKWYIEAIRDIMIKGLGLKDVLLEISVLTLMAIVLITASLKKFKIRSGNKSRCPAGIDTQHRDYGIGPANSAVWQCRHRRPFA